MYARPTACGTVPTYEKRVNPGMRVTSHPHPTRFHSRARAWPTPEPHWLPVWTSAADTARAAVTARGQPQDRSSASCSGLTVMVVGLEGGEGGGWSLLPVTEPDPPGLEGGEGVPGRHCRGQQQQQQQRRPVMQQQQWEYTRANQVFLQCIHRNLQAPYCCGRHTNAN